MTLSDEFAKLQELHERGALSDEEFTRAKALLLSGSPRPTDSPMPPTVFAAINGVRRSRSDRWIAGVCGGLARAIGLEAWVLRLVFAVLLLFGGFGLLIYALLWIFVPDE
ncbi:MAG: PspC domain-containing protein [Burkholderiaceae bacterium]